MALNINRSKATVTANLVDQEAEFYNELHSKGIKALAIFRRGLETYKRNEGDSTINQSTIEK